MLRRLDPGNVSRLLQRLRLYLYSTVALSPSSSLQLNKFVCSLQRIREGGAWLIIKHLYSPIDDENGFFKCVLDAFSRGILRSPRTAESLTHLTLLVTNPSTVVDPHRNYINCPLACCSALRTLSFFDHNVAGIDLRAWLARFSVSHPVYAQDRLPDHTLKSSTKTLLKTEWFLDNPSPFMGSISKGSQSDAEDEYAHELDQLRVYLLRFLITYAVAKSVWKNFLILALVDCVKLGTDFLADPLRRVELFGIGCVRSGERGPRTSCRCQC